MFAFAGHIFSGAIDAVMIGGVCNELTGTWEQIMNVPLPAMPSGYMSGFYQPLWSDDFQQFMAIGYVTGGASWVSALLESPDGENWDLSTGTLPDEVQFSEMAYSPTLHLWVVVGVYGILSSTDAVNWTTRYAGTHPDGKSFNSVVWS